MQQVQVKRALQLGADKHQRQAFESDEPVQLVVWAGQRFPEKDLGSFQVLPQGWVGLAEGKWDPRQEAD